MRIATVFHPSIKLDLAYHGGIERVALGELDGLAALGHSCGLYASEVKGEKTNVHRLRDFGWHNRVLKFLYYINFGLRNPRAEVMHGHFTPLLALLYPGRAAVHFHGLAVSELPLYRFFGKRYHRAHYVFCARWVMDEFRDIYPGIPEDRLHVLYNGVDIDAIVPRPDRADVMGKDVVKICFYAGWIPEKGIYDVLDAAEILEGKGRRDFKICFGGSAYMHYRESRWGDPDEINEKVKSRAAGLRSVELVGSISKDGLPAFLSGMDLGLVPSTYPDPFPLVPLEMMAAGLPVIAYDLGGLRESVLDGETGYLVPNERPDLIAQKIERLLDNRAELARMGTAARRHVEENFSLDVHIRGLVEIYREMKSKRRGRR